MVQSLFMQKLLILLLLHIGATDLNPLFLLLLGRFSCPHVYASSHCFTCLLLCIMTSFILMQMLHMVAVRIPRRDIEGFDFGRNGHCLVHPPFESAGRELTITALVLSVDNLLATVMIRPLWLSKPLSCRLSRVLQCRMNGFLS